MVDAITAVSASSATSPTRVESSLSITSEPDNKYVAERQAKIDADQLALKLGRPETGGDGAPDSGVDDEDIPLFEGHSRKPRHDREVAGHQRPEEEIDHPALSGESDRIGTTNFDEDTPFGDRVAIL